MEHQYDKNVRVVCDLSIGEYVRTDGWGYKLDGKDLLIEDIKYSPNCQSGFLVKVDKYESYIDSSWLNKK